MLCTNQSISAGDFRLGFRLLLFAVLLVSPACVARPSYIDESVHKKLMQFGYLPQSNLETGELRHEDDVIKGLMEMQKFAGIPATGKMDKATVKLLDTPRCGLPDKEDRGFRSKRYVKQGSSWKQHKLTWTLKTLPRKRGLDSQVHTVRQELSYAFKLWQKNSKLSFEEVHESVQADILVGFFETRHGDNYPFDGEGQVLAHAFFPGPGIGGDVHFDEAEMWNLYGGPKNDRGASFFFVAAHEIGHALGLSHSSEKQALMYPWYVGSNATPSTYELPWDDKIGIQEIYGVVEKDRWGPMPTPSFGKETTRRPPVMTTRKPSPGKPTQKPEHPEHPVQPKPTKPLKPDTCDTSYDAITYFRNSELWIFKGEYFWRVKVSKDNQGSEKGLGVWEGYPLRIDSSLQNFCHHTIKHVDAVYTRQSDGALVFFQGKQFIVCSGRENSRAEVRPLTYLGLNETVEKVDAAFVWGHNGKTYLFSGNSYWRIDDDTGKVELDYPRDMSMWSGVGYNIDAAFKWKDGHIYFFKGKSYWKFNDMTMKVAHEKPMLSAPFWMGCPRRLEEPLNARQEPVTAAAVSVKDKMWLTLALLCLVSKFSFLP
ncbi:matrix metalloproteinase-2-like isoform X2 [Neocloeon triangulifer]|uniref:matrix metalloproteinase-2-like isoform X2 n=1 Tax=Neocloeon triangulifer TaxID=2078957 RepID=UPI00286F9466|nr:matrix metalloproteinase-2-like isoform X2 [Neocloeon triangulifer]